MWQHVDIHNLTKYERTKLISMVAVFLIDTDTMKEDRDPIDVATELVASGNLPFKFLIKRN